MGAGDCLDRSSPDWGCETPSPDGDEPTRAAETAPACGRSAAELGGRSGASGAYPSHIPRCAYHPGMATVAASVETICRLLPREDRPDPPLAVLDELVGTVLSQHTSDHNSDRAFASLQRRFPSWEAVVAADLAQVADSIRCGGLAERKAATIQSLLREIERREERLDLERLRQLADREVESYLTSLPGVGPKTAACVLLFALGRPVLPVDTHVHRVATRLGWLPGGTTAERAHGLLAAAVPAHLRRDLHLALIAHGRRVCTARRPRCAECVLRRLCPSAGRSG